MACVPTEQAAMPCAINIRLLTGPELLAGSTRLKAGTATKMALNI
jgi:N-acetylmuramic acid 6-phosphate etherase